MSAQPSAFLHPPLRPAAIEPPRRPRPIAGARVRLGSSFPLPTEDFEDDALDLNELLVRNEPATFFYRAAGRSMASRGISDGDILVVDRSLTATHGDIVLAMWDGNAPVCKVMQVRGGRLELHSDESTIHVPEASAVEVYVVTGVVRVVTRGRTACSR